MDTLIVKTFTVVLVMLAVTAVTARKKQEFKSKGEFWIIFLGMLGLVIFIPSMSMPFNLLAALVYAGLMGCLIGPGIKGMMMQFVMKKYLVTKGYTKEKLLAMPVEEQQTLMTTAVSEIKSGAHQSIIKEWDNLVTLALLGTGGITLLTAFVVSTSDTDFSFLGQTLFIALIALIVISLLNVFVFKSRMVHVVGTYIGALLFSLYLIYDFNRLEEMVKVGANSWDVAIQLAISLYLDIVNLFMILLDILSS